MGLRPVDAAIAARFDRIELAGSGGMGEVYRARDRATGAEVALKLLSGIGASTQRFEREATVLAQLDHPGIVKYLDHGVTPAGDPFLVMEWLTGEDLDHHLARGPMSIPDVLAIARGLASALAAAHARGVVHRDLKPANVFLLDGRPDQLKILDFGLAQRHGDESLTVPGTVVGTPAYMAPEQVRGDALDTRADVYALGAVVLRCVIGRPPFSGASPLAILAKVVVERPPGAREARPETPDELDALLRRMLDKSRDARPRDAAEVLRALEDIDATSVSPPFVPSAITAREQRVACVVLCASSTDADATLSSKEEARATERVRVAVERCGGALEALTRNHWLVTIRAAPSPAEEAARAARCALEIAKLRTSAPIVVATGRVVVAGDVQVGEVVDRATQALLAATTGGAKPGVRIDDATADLLGDRFDVAGASPWRTLLAERTALVAVRTLLGKPASCVGRAQELALLAAAAAECRTTPRARPVLVKGGPGLGKSRLVHEFLAASLATQRGVQVLQARGDAMASGSPFGMASQVLRRAAAILDSDPLAVRAQKLRALCARTFDPARAARAEELLGEICGARPADVTASAELCAARADITVMADVLREAWTDWLRALTSGDGTLVVLVLEDVHWADLPTMRLVEAALDGLHDRPLLVVATSRPEGALPTPAVWRARGLQEIGLGPLSARAAERLVREALGTAADEPTVQGIVARAAGHPFHLEELIRAAVSGRPDDALPDTVLGMIQVRLGVLAADARRVLRAASVFGETFWSGAVAALMGEDVSAAQVDLHLGELARQEIITRRAGSRIAGEAEYAFRHALVRDAAYAMLTDADRRLAHELAGAWLERSGETDPAVLAEHFDRGGARAKARVFLVRAAAQALAGNDFDRAMRASDRALVSDPSPAEEGELLAIQAEVLYWHGDLETAAARAGEATHHLHPGSAAWFDAVSVAVGALGQRGLNSGVAEWLGRAAGVEARPGAAAAKAIALCRGMTQLSWAHYGGPLEGVREGLDRLVGASDRALDRFASGWVHRVRGESAWLHARDVDRCLAEIDASCAAFDEARALRPLCLTRLNGASLTGWSGQVERGLAMVQRANKDAARLGSGFLTSYAHAVRGLLLAYGGDAQASAVMASCLDALAGSPRLAFICRFVLGNRAVDAGALDAAEEHVRVAASLPVVRDLQPAGLALASRIALARGHVDEAARHAHAAVETQRACPDLELTAGVAELALAEALDARGETDAARGVLAEVHGALARIAGTIASAEGREHFWARRLPNDAVRARARAWGLE